MTRRDRPDPSELPAREAAERYLRRRRPDSTDKSIKGWRYRLKLFVEWCESVGITEVGQLRGYDIDEYYELRSSEIAPATLEGEMHTLRKFVEFLENIEAVDEDLHEKVRVPNLDPEDRTNDTKLATDDALALLEYYRNSEQDYGTRAHAYLELAWTTGARQGGLRALDIRDVYLDDNPWVHFLHRPESGTPLKNKRAGQRPVVIPRETANVLQTFIDTHRYDVHDDNGRQPLLASATGRPTPNTVRVWSYMATQPCLHTVCPHGKERATCGWVERNHASKCPSSRSPHQIRTGAITHMLNLGWPPEDVAERVNAAVKTIEQHYDHADPRERQRRLRDRMEKRRRPLVEDLNPTNEIEDRDY